LVSQSDYDQAIGRLHQAEANVEIWSATAGKFAGEPELLHDLFAD